MISEKNVARNENEKTQERPTKTSYCLHDLTLKKKRVAENKSCTSQQKMTHFLSLGDFILSIHLVWLETKFKNDKSIAATGKHADDHMFYLRPLIFRGTDFINYKVLLCKDIIDT